MSARHEIAAIIILACALGMALGFAAAPVELVRPPDVEQPCPKGT